MIKRFNPDFSLSISHELAYMRETPEGGYVAHGDYATLFSELELVKADRDAQQKRADALAVENAEMRETLTYIIDNSNMPEYHYEGMGCGLEDRGITDPYDAMYHGWECAIGRVYSDVIPDAIPETPATSAALDAIEARGAIAAIESLIGKKKRALAEMHPDTHAYGATEVIIRNQIRDLKSFADELREAK
jgi:hypothetical protein